MVQGSKHVPVQEAGPGDIIVMLDADGSTDPVEIPAFFGAVIDEAFTGQVKCTVIATGFDAPDTTQPAMFSTPAQRYLTKAPVSPRAEQSGRSFKEEKIDMSAKSTGNMINVDAGNAQAFTR